MDGVSGFVFDPSRLRQSPKRLERDGYALAGRLLRDQLGGDPLADIRRRARRDPQLRTTPLALAGDLARAAALIKSRLDEDGG